ncbi:Z1 domain-containing protein [Bacillus songklensis]|uniref:Z1 domain-containing protein n=1 Tax=Bacillus songklensis TaxID=1069116 RepID=A0ABV8B9H4_9BACI
MENRADHLRPVDIEEIERLADTQGNDEDITTLPKGLLEALSAFVIGASIRIFDNTESRVEQKFSFLCHISPFQDIHARIKRLIKKFLIDLYKALKMPDASETREFILGCLSQAYNDLYETHPNIPEFPVILKALSDNINSHEVIVLNAAPSSHSDIKLNKKFNFIIGGNKLGRGLTIPRLLVTYYGRLTARPQVDTLMQHARMCGYRSKDLSVTRVFVPEEIANIFAAICEHDSTQRDIIKNHAIEGTLYLDTSRVGPTRPPVIPKSVGAYRAGQSTFPKLPEYPQGEIEEVTQCISKEVTHLEKSDEILEVNIDFVTNIIEKIPFLTSGGWYPEVINKYLSWYKENYSDVAQLIYTLDTNIGPSRSRGNQGLVIGSVLSPGIQELVSASDSNKPLVVLIRNKGHKWEGVDFWIPWFRFPENDKNILFNLNNH